MIIWIWLAPRLARLRPEVARLRTSLARLRPDGVVRRNRVLLTPVIVGTVLRVAWGAIVVGRGGLQGETAAGTVEVGRALSQMDGPSTNGAATAVTAPFEPVLLAPFLRVGDALGVEVGPTVVVVADVVAGSLTVFALGLLAIQWFGPGTGRVTAWLAAVTPVPVLLVTAGTGDTITGLLVVATLVVLSHLALERSSPWHAPAGMAVVGLLIGLAALASSSSLVLLVPLLLVIARVPDAPTVRRMGWALGALVVVLLPWSVVNGVRVGLWSPVGAEPMALVCHAHGVGGGDADLTPPRDLPPCADGEADTVGLRDEVGRAASAIWPPNEAAAVGVTTVRALVTASPGPVERLEGSWGRPLGGPTRTTLAQAVTAWHGSVAAIAVLAVVVLPSVRRARPIWVTGLLLTAATVIGADPPRHGLVLHLLALVAVARFADAAGSAPGPADLPTPGAHGPG